MDQDQGILGGVQKKSYSQIIEGFVLISDGGQWEGGKKNMEKWVEPAS